MIKRLSLALPALALALAGGCGDVIDCNQVTYTDCQTLAEARANARSEQETRDLTQCYRENCTDEGSDGAANDSE